jgi:ubiquinone/menaquinone biosynthesis C-methylase UbiE
MTVDEIATIAAAFTRTAARYDAFAEDHPHLTRLRQQVYDVVVRHLPPGGRVLELNAGTGTDAVQLAGLGFEVHATDIAEGMLDRLRQKIAAHGLERRVSFQPCSFLDLEAVTGGPYDAVFSNLGGLNCTADLRPVARGIDHLLSPGGTAILVVMPPICLWELALVFKGQIRLAFRRLSRGGTRAHLEGRHFTVHYFGPREVIAAFGPGYEVHGLRGLSVVTPTAESKNLAKRHQRLYGALARLDDAVAGRAPFSRWGDFFILVLRRRQDAQAASAPAAGRGAG